MVTKLLSKLVRRVMWEENKIPLTNILFYHLVERRLFLWCLNNLWPPWKEELVSYMIGYKGRRVKLNKCRKREKIREDNKHRVLDIVSQLRTRLVRVECARAVAEHSGTTTKEASFESGSGHPATTTLSREHPAWC
jgi:hypothetical protein